MIQMREPDYIFNGHPSTQIVSLSCARSCTIPSYVLLISVEIKQWKSINFSLWRERTCNPNACALEQ